MSDQDRISLYQIKTISKRQVMRRNNDNWTEWCNLGWNHTRDFKIEWARSTSSIWNHKYDFRPKLVVVVVVNLYLNSVKNLQFQSFSLINLSTPMSDQDRISLYQIYTIPKRQVMRINNSNWTEWCNLGWNHTRDFKIKWARSTSSIWNHKYDFRPKLVVIVVVNYLNSVKNLQLH